MLSDGEAPCGKQDCPFKADIIQQVCSEDPIHVQDSERASEETVADGGASQLVFQPKDPLAQLISELEQEPCPHSPCDMSLAHLVEHHPDKVSIIQLLCCHQCMGIHYASPLIVIASLKVEHHDVP